MEAPGPARAFHRRLLLFDAGLVVEVDGGQHADRVAYDESRTAWLERTGLRVLRFWNSDVLTNCNGVCLAILEACGGEHPNASPPTGERAG